jgi:hypothetical protein
METSLIFQKNKNAPALFNSTEQDFPNPFYNISKQNIIPIHSISLLSDFFLIYTNKFCNMWFIPVYPPKGPGSGWTWRQFLPG